MFRQDEKRRTRRANQFGAAGTTEGTNVTVSPLTVTVPLSLPWFVPRLWFVATPPSPASDGF